MGLHLFFLPNFPGATFIQGGTFIPDSRVNKYHQMSTVTSSDAGTGSPPIFGRSINPIPTGEGRLSPPITTGTPNVFHLLASLTSIEH